MQIMTTMSVKRQNMNSCNPEAVTRDKAGRHSDQQDLALPSCLYCAEMCLLITSNYGPAIVNNKPVVICNTER